MTNDKGILIKNIYYMLAYAFRVLRQENYESVASEEFDDVRDLFAAILFKGISQQLKQGLYKEYITKTEDLQTLRGKLDINGTIRNEIQRKKKLTCEYDELSVDNIYNRILKTTMSLLVREPSVKKERKSDLKKVLLFFDDVETVEPSTIKWNMLRFQRNNRNYEMLINVCYFVLDGMLQTTENGRYKMKAFSDEHMELLYENFILQYYRKEHPELRAEAMMINWQVDDDRRDMLPIMQTDITLSSKDRSRILIIDAKYYGQILNEHHDKYTINSANLYQIFAYVKNKETEMKMSQHEVAGMLLYAKTGEEVYPENEYQMSGNKISVRTLDLNRDFEKIREQLDGIADSYFDEK